MADDPNAKSNPNCRSFEEQHWARLSPLFRAAHNRLRQARGLPPIPEPEVDLYEPPKRPAVRPVNPANLVEVEAAAAGFLGRDDPARSWLRGAQGFIESDRPADQDQHTKIVDRPRYLVTLTDEEFARLSPARRALYNRLRQQYGRPPIPEPAVDLSPKPHVPPPKLFDNANPLARAIVKGDDPGGHLWQKLLAETKAALDSDRRPRPAHRPKREGRTVAEHATMTLLGIWDRLKPEHRLSFKTVLGEIKDSYGISRNEVFNLLKEARKRAQRRRHATD